MTPKRAPRSALRASRALRPTRAAGMPADTPISACQTRQRRDGIARGRCGQRVERRCRAGRPAPAAMRGSSRRLVAALRLARRALRLRCGRASAAGCRAHRSPSRSPSSGSVAASRRNLQRALEGHRAAEAELEAELDEGLRLLLAAVEGMRDAARLPGATCRRCFSTLVDRAPHVQDHRQLVLARQLQLRVEEALLRARGPGPATK